MARFQHGAHNVHVACAIECKIATPIRHLNELILNGLALFQLIGVHKVRSAELFSPGLLGIVYIDDDDLAGLALYAALNHGETYTACTEDGDVVTGCYLRCLDRCTAYEVQQGRTLTAEAAGTVGHDTTALCGANLVAEVRFARLAERAFLALWGVQGNDMVARLDGGDAAAHRLDDAGAFVA